MALPVDPLGTTSLHGAGAAGDHRVRAVGATSARAVVVEPGRAELSGA